ncbi:M48 family metallopeptidase [Sphingobium sp. Cam5-1]|uniref:M48 family metallopeptidase n=2 Tax=unclassified Sphingobium TaxID=2611147 RepID=UPI0018AD29F9|nr:M48 family metallopeptidase [Sphingobium sp. Cam5-1]QPI75387.1 peptidase M48 family protein [Sphingobium sp. Cam5-1]
MGKVDRVASAKWWKREAFRPMIMAIALAVPGPLASADVSPPFEAIRAVDAEMARLGRRLAVANASLCDRQEPSLGLMLHTPAQYARDVRAAAIRHFRFDGPIGIEAVVEGSPAAAAGIRADDTLMAVGPARFPPADPQARANTSALADATRRIMALPVDRPLTLHLRRGGHDQERVVVPEPACRTRFEVVLGPDFLAQADGEVVQIGSRFFADYPDWVVAPIAHELAHNVLRHRERLEARGVDYGLLSGMGRNVGYFRQTELEADILSVSLLANAGFDPAIAVIFWRAFGPAHDGGIRSRSHPAWKDRVRVIERAIADLGPERPHRPSILAARNKPLDGNWQTLLDHGH